MDTITRGGECLDSSPRRTTSDHHELPIKMAVGGGHKNLIREGGTWNLRKVKRPCERRTASPCRKISAPLCLT
jgi:hypothetical protein